MLTLMTKVFGSVAWFKLWYDRIAGMVSQKDTGKQYIVRR